MKNHRVKSWPEFFGPVFTGKKSFELRRNDRDYLVGEWITMQEYEPRDRSYTGREVTKQITYVLHGIGVGAIEPLKGLAMGYCILQLENLDADFREVEERAA
jgi:hypothetical protein